MFFNVASKGYEAPVYSSAARDEISTSRRSKS